MGLWEAVIVGDDRYGDEGDKYPNRLQDVVHLVDVVPNEELVVLPQRM